MYRIIIQQAADNAFVPASTLLRKWAKKALSQKNTRQMKSAEMTLRIVNTDEMTTLNSTYRHKKGPTNVLSFPFTTPADIVMDRPLLGDIIICADVVNREAQEQQKTPESHWAHMIIHGVFHLLGFDHEIESEADIMETMEIEVMQALGFANPYLMGENIKDYD